MQIVNKPNRLSISRRALIAVACLPFIALTAYATNALRLQVEEPSALKSAAASKEEQEKVKARRVVHQVNPKWPGEKSDYPDKYQTSVILGLTVDEEGVPLNVHVVKSGGAPFDASAMDAVSQYRFSPGPAVKLNMEIHFQRY